MDRLQDNAAGAGAQGPASIAPSQLLAAIGAMLRELRGGDVPPLALDDDLERTLGIDSLARMELMLRLEQAFQVRMPETLVQAAQTPRDRQVHTLPDDLLRLRIALGVAAVVQDLNQPNP